MSKRDPRQGLSTTSHFRRPNFTLACLRWRRRPKRNSPPPVVLAADAIFWSVARLAHGQVFIIRPFFSQEDCISASRNLILLFDP